MGNGCLFKCCFKILCYFYNYGIVKNQHFQSILLGEWEIGHQKNVSAAFDNVDNCGRPLRQEGPTLSVPLVSMHYQSVVNHCDTGLSWVLYVCMYV